MRFLLGNLEGFTEAERVAPKDMPELEQWVLHRRGRTRCRGAQRLWQI
ncbi:MAG: hypothetical protein V9G14_16165 [Cypionkella sp.]